MGINILLICITSWQIINYFNAAISMTRWPSDGLNPVVLYQEQFASFVKKVFQAFGLINLIFAATSLTSDFVFSISLSVEIM